MKDYLDIKHWCAGKLSGIKNDSQNTSRVIIKFDPKKVYALLQLFISDTPNGAFTIMSPALGFGAPIERMVWWDFEIKSDIGSMHIIRTNRHLEVISNISVNEFNILKFINDNLKNYSLEIDDKIKTYDKFLVIINHYDSYKKCVDYLWKEVSNLKLNEPESPKDHLIEVDENAYKEQLKIYEKESEGYLKESIKFHTLGKSLLLNSAFQIESLLNLMIRLTLHPATKNYPDIINKYLSFSFKDKLRNIKFFCPLFIKDIDTEEDVIIRAIDLMKIRNKYVHSDYDSDVNTIDEVYFENEFPLCPTQKSTQGIFFIKQVYHNPSFKIVEKYHTLIKDFEDYIFSLINPKYLDYLKMMLEQNPLGFDKISNRLKKIQNSDMPDFFLRM